jgi:SecD/SecF fusion protein
MPSFLTDPFYLKLYTFIALVVGSTLLGGWLARTLRLPEYGWRFGVILFAVLTSLVVICWGWPPKLGVDLGGGVILVYQVDPEKLPEGGLDQARMDQLVARVSERVNPGGQREISVRPLGSDKVQITMPQAGEEEARRIKLIISRAGALEFRILATRHDDLALVERALAEPGGRSVSAPDGTLEAKWEPVRIAEAPSFVSNPQLATRWVPVDARQAANLSPEVATRKDASGTLEKLEVLVKVGPWDVFGERLRQAATGYDEEGRPCVHFQFDSIGAESFGRLTTENRPSEGFYRQLSIILDDVVYSAPRINSPIYDRGQITGSFTQAEVNDLVKVLNAGSLPAALKKDPVRDLTTGPTLGGDTIHKSALAMIISAVAVPLFMIWYYRFAGLVAVVALALNMAILIAIMIIVKAPFTLPALAGLALTVGMDVDNNVLIYERLREELAHGAALRMAIRNAFHRAGVVIIDANITHLIAATVLFVEGTEQVKGFAITFWLGAVLSIWATMFVARVIFEVFERKRWLTRVKMLHVIGHTEIDFMKWFPACATFSVLITVVGLAVALYRYHEGGLLDIDFTSGVSVQALFTSPEDITDIRRRTENLPDVTVNDIRLADEEPGERFMISTSDNDLEQVKQQLWDIFGKELRANSMTVAGVTAIGETPPAAKPPAEKPAGKEEAAKPQEKPAVKEKEEKAKPTASRTRSDLPPDSLLAMAGSPAELLAQAAKPQAEKPAAKENSKPPAEKLQQKPAAKPPPEKPEEEPPARKPAVNPYAGGTQAELSFQFKVDHDTVAKKVAQVMEELHLPDMPPPRLTNPNYVENDTSPYEHWTLSVKLPRQSTEALLARLEQEVSKMPYFPDVDAIGPSVASDTCYYAWIALVASWVLIILYLWIRFQGVAFGLAAVIALIHDVLVMLGAIAFSFYLPQWLSEVTLIGPFKINLQIVAAFLTIIGYSVNDTIVVFDRIREVRGKSPRITRQIVNDSTNQTLSRTLLTSFTVLLVVAILYLFGGPALHGFAFALMIGVLTGTYSSIYVAAPILLWFVHPKEIMRRATAE